MPPPPSINSNYLAAHEYPAYAPMFSDLPELVKYAFRGLMYANSFTYRWCTPALALTSATDSQFHEMVHECLERNIIREYCLGGLPASSVRACGMSCGGIEFR
jgi:hypothetical protein